MRHRVRGRKLGRNASHRKAMFRNMACSLIRTVRVDEDDPQKPSVPGRIITTLPKAKELRPFVEKLVTLAKKAVVHEQRAAEFETDAERNSDAWTAWRKSDDWQKWSAAKAPAVAMRRRAFAMLRDHEALDILFDELAERFEDRDGGYTRVVRLAEVRLGDSGRKALIEFVGQNDRVKSTRRAAPVIEDEAAEDDESPVAEGDVATAESEVAVSDEPTAELDDDKSEEPS